MNALLEAREPSARFLAAIEPPLLGQFDLIAQAPNGVARLRELVLTLAVQGKMVPQEPNDEPASALLERIRAEKARLVKEGKIRKEKPLADIAEDEKPFVLPARWEWARLGQIASRVQYGYTASADHSVPSPKLLRITDIQNDQVNWASVPGVQAAQQDLSGYFLESGDLLIARTGGTIGKTFLVTSAPVSSVFASYLIRVSPLSGVAPTYLKIFASSAFYWAQLLASSMGTGQPNVNGTALSELVLPIPPLAEQSRIVARVEELMALCDALEAKGKLEAEQHARLVDSLFESLANSESAHALAENWQCIATHFDLLLDRPAAVDALEQTILQLAVRGLIVPQDPDDEPASVLLQKNRLIAAGQLKRDKPLPPVADEEMPFELPDGWVWVKAKMVFEFLNGYAFKSEWFKTSGIRLLRNINVSHGFVDWAQAACIDPAQSSEYGRFSLHAGDIVLSLDRPLISTGLKYAVIRACDLPCLLLQRVAKLTPEKNVISAQFAELWLNSELFTSAIDPGRSNGVPHISTKQLEAMPIALPPIAEQPRIVARVNELRALCSTLRQRLAAAQQTQSRLAEALVESVC